MSALAEPRPSTGRPHQLTQTDNELIAEIRHGDERAFAAFHARHHGRAHRAALQILHDEQLAEEAVQDAFMNLWRRPHDYNGSLASPTTWLLSVVRHRAIDCRRRERRRLIPAEDPAIPFARLAASDDVEAQVLHRERWHEVRLRMQDLPSGQRVALELNYLEQLTHREVADKLWIPVGTAKSRIRLGLTRLSSVLETTAN
jgi:RNA polymerase sigma factor (sigma-70 family)